MIPGVGGLLAPVAGQLVGQLVKEAEAEAESMEATHFVGEGEMEVSNTETAHEAALAEVLAGQAAEAATEAEAESMISAALPITITITPGARRATRRVLPVLTQANRRIVRAIRSSGVPDARQVLRVMPAIQTRTAIALRNAQRRGIRVTGPLATRVMATVARRVLNNTPLVARTIARNVAIRHTLAPSHRTAAGVARCTACVGRGRAAVAARGAVRAAGPAARRPIVSAGATAAHRRPRPRV